MSIARVTYLGICLIWSASLLGQCSIDIGNDTTVCAGQPVTINAPSGFPNYTWSDGTNGTSITTNTDGWVWCEVSYTTPELVFNGDFSQGNTGFTTDYTLADPVWNDPEYNITWDASQVHPQFNGFGHNSGNFFVGNGGSNSPGLHPWCQQIVDLCPNTNYTISAWFCSVEPQHPAELQFELNGVNVGPVFNPPSGPGVWVQHSVNWNSGNSTTLDLCIVNWNGWGAGNDFGIDDISMIGNVVLRDSLLITHIPLPVVDLGNDTTLCAGEDLLLDVTRPGGSYEWQDLSTNGTFNVSSAGGYSVIVTENGCSDSDNIVVSYNPLPVVDLGNDTTLCQGQVLTLNAFQFGASYEWQDGSTNPTLNVNTAGIYWVDVDKFGCITRDSITVAIQALPVVELGNDTTLCAGEFLTLDATNAGASYLWQDNSTNPTLLVNGPGLYSVDVSIGYCTVGDAINVSYNPLPAVDLGNDTAICQGASLLLDATQPGASYAWQDGSTNPTFSTSTSGTFWVDVTLNDCVYRDSIDVLVAPIPTVDLGNDTTLCAGQELVLDATNAGASYLWQDNSTNPTFNVIGPGLYSVTASIGNCSDNDAINVNYNPLPAVDLGNDTAICQGASLLLDATLPGASYAWQDGSTNPTFSTSTSGTFWVDVTLNDCVYRDSIDVLVAPIPTVDLGNDTTLCAGQELVLDATNAGANYLWQDNSTNPTFNVSGPGQYSVTASIGNCSDNDAINVSYTPLPTVDLGNDTAICQGASLLLDATLPGAGYAWQDGSTNPTFNTSTSGTFWVDVTLNDCVYRDSIDVSITPIPTVDIGPDQTICDGSLATFDATLPGGSYLWHDNSNNATLTTGTAGLVWVETTVNNCSDRDSAMVIVQGAIVLDLGNDTTICADDQFTLDATVSGATYLWNDNSVGPTILAEPGNTYWVDVTAGTCFATDTIVVGSAPVPVVALGNDTTLCAGETLNLDASFVGASYEWQDNSTAPTFLVSSSGQYWVEVTLGSCSASDTLEANYISPQGIDLGNDTAICEGATLMLDASLPGGSYVWQDNSTAATFEVSSAGSYWVEVASNGCSATDTIVVNTIPLPTVNLGPDTLVCPGSTVVLNANVPGGSYVWSDNSIGPTTVVSTVGDHWVEVTLNGCTDRDTIALAHYSLPVVDLGNDTTLCPGANLLIDASTPGGSYAWQDGSAGNTLLATGPGIYWVDVSVNGCVVRDSVSVNYLNVQALDLGNDSTLCDGQTLQLNANLPGATFAWQDGSTLSNFNVSNPGVYWVEATISGCSISDTIELDYLPLPTVDLGNDTTICAGQSLTLDATTPGGTYLWQDASNGPSINVGAAGNYWVEVQLNGCASSDTIQVQLQTLPLVELGADTALCLGETILLNAGNFGAQYLWQDASTSPTYLVNSSGNYYVDVDLNGCIGSDSIQVQYVDPGSISLGNDTAICLGASLVLDASTPGVDYLWQDGSTGPTFTANGTGLYWVEISIANCTARDSITIGLAPMPTADLGPDFGLCLGESQTLDVTQNGATYLWQDGSTGSQFEVQSAGQYSVSVELGGCTTSDEVMVHPLNVPQVSWPNSQTTCIGVPLLLDANYPGAQYLWYDGSSSSFQMAEDPGTYSVEVSNTCGSVQLSTELITEDCSCRLFVPNAFTPNGDANNQVFQPVLECEPLSYVMYIYNRRGRLIFETFDKNAHWDGTFEGQPVQDGIYVWMVEFTAIGTGSGQSEKRIGHVSVLR